MAFVIYRNDADDVFVTSEASESLCLAEHFDTSGSYYTVAQWDALTYDEKKPLTERLQKFTRTLVSTAAVHMVVSTFGLVE